MINKSTYFINELSPCIDFFFQNCGSGLSIYEKCRHKFIYGTLTHFSPMSLKRVKFRCIPSSFLMSRHWDYKYANTERSIQKNYFNVGLTQNFPKSKFKSKM